MARYVQYGCGTCVPEGWENFDASPTARMQKWPVIGRFVPGLKFPASVRYGNIVRGLPVDDASVDGAYCSHTLEHLAKEDCQAALRNTFRMLKPGGIFRMVLPDLKILVQSYLADPDAEAANKFMTYSWLGQPTRPGGVKRLLKYFYSNAEHRWMWDFKSLSTELAKVGFVEIREAKCHDSGDAMFDRAEDPDRWTDSLGMQCRRPVQ